MKTRIQGLILILSLVLIFTSCKKDDTPNNPAPTASFSYTGNGIAPSKVSFTNSSGNATSYLWDFGDNEISTESSPSHTYTKGGVFTVKLTATGSGGSNSVTKTVNIGTPTSVKIKAVTITQIPFTTTGGGGWDNNSGPDLTYTLTDVNDVELANPGTYYPNVTSSQLPLSFVLNTPYQITNFATNYKINIWDYDGDDLPPNPNDFIGGYQFSLSEFANAGYPATATLYLAGNSVKIDLVLQWQ